MGRVGNIAMGILTLIWGAGLVADPPTIEATSYRGPGWGTPPLWVGPNPYWRPLGVFFVLWGVVFIYLGLRRKKPPPESD